MNEEVLFQKIARYLSGNCSDEERKFIDQWKEENESNRQMFSELSKIWEGQDSGLPDLKIDTEAALEKVHRELDRSESPKLKSYTLLRTMLRYAAIFILVVGAAFLASKLFIHSETVQFVSADKIREVELPDGSRLWINKNSSVILARSFNKHKRKIKFEGEGYFEIAHNPHIPFIIEAQGTVTEILGTKFNLNARHGAGDVVLSLVEGKVAFRAEEAKSKVIILKPGEEAEFRKKDKSIWKQEATENYLAWRTKRLVFRNTPLYRALKEIGTLYEVEMTTADSSLEKVKINAVMDSLPLTSVIQLLEESLDVKISEEEGKYRLTKPKS